MTNRLPGGQAFQIVPNLVIRRRLEGPNNASIHSAATDGADVTEVMAIPTVRGMIMTGGTYVDQASEYQKKDRAKGITGGVAREVKAGDVIGYRPAPLLVPEGKRSVDAISFDAVDSCHRRASTSHVSKTERHVQPWWRPRQE